jgi:hypothetical protein
VELLLRASRGSAVVSFEQVSPGERSINRQADVVMRLIALVPSISGGVYTGIKLWMTLVQHNLACNTALWLAIMMKVVSVQWQGRFARRHWVLAECAASAQQNLINV